MVKFVLIIFIITGERSDVIGAQLQMKAFECIQHAIEINQEGANRYAACMPLPKD
jgi:hypothetical protein